MTEAVWHDLKLVGTTSAGGGRYRNIRVTGECDLRGDIECGKLHGMGQLAVGGSLRAALLNWTGECRAEGPFLAGSFRGRGDFHAGGGSRGEDVRLTGSIRVGGDFECGSFKLFGGFEIDGLLSADRMEASMVGPCHAKEIGGGSIVVRRSRTAAVQGLVKPVDYAALTADSVEGDLLDLRHAKLGVARGNRVIVGPGCEIGLVEYRTIIDIHKNAKVHKLVRL